VKQVATAAAAAAKSEERDDKKTTINEGKTEEVSEDGPESTVNATAAAAAATMTEFVGMESNDGICPPTVPTLKL
jgi:Pyruvate/2-oxoacid:ferredoxin oxidoreductase gamma subunit